MEEKKRFSRWTSDQIIATIKDLHRNGLSLSPRANKNLYYAAIGHFGSYQKALEAAKLSYKKLGIRCVKKWSREKIIETIQDFHRKGNCLNTRYIRTRHPSLYAVACYYFQGGWKKLVETAGIDYKEIKKGYGWDKISIVKEIRSLHRQGKSLQPVQNKKLFGAACRHFGSYQEAIKKAGLSYRKLHLRLSWTEEEIKAELRKRLQRKKSLKAAELSKDDAGLYAAARKFFGSYAKALEASGIDPKGIIRSFDAFGWVKRLSNGEAADLSERIKRIYSGGGNEHEDSSN
jgi:hypothetical protein